MTLSAILSLAGDSFQLVVSEGEILDSEELPAFDTEDDSRLFRDAAGIELTLAR